MRIEIRRKYTLATRRNCSHIDFGSHVSKVYFVVLIEFEFPFVLVTSVVPELISNRYQNIECNEGAAGINLSILPETSLMFTVQGSNSAGDSVLFTLAGFPTFSLISTNAVVDTAQDSHSLF